MIDQEHLLSLPSLYIKHDQAHDRERDGTHKCPKSAGHLSALIFIGREKREKGSCIGLCIPERLTAISFPREEREMEGRFYRQLLVRAFLNYLYYDLLLTLSSNILGIFWRMSQSK